MLASALLPATAAQAMPSAPLDRARAAERPARTLVRWAPPRLQRPLRVDVPVSGLDAYFAAGRDIILDLPDVPVEGEVRTTGGDDIRVVGGKIGGGTSFRGEYGIVARDLRGSLFVEGVEIDFSRVWDRDNIVATGYAPGGTGRAGWSYPAVYIQNSRLLGARWSGGPVHPDLYQKQGPQGALFMDRVTGEASYQGLMIGATSFSGEPGPGERHVDGMRYTEIRRTNLAHRADHTIGYLAWLVWNDGSRGFEGDDPWPVVLNGFYLQPVPGQDLRRNLVWPRGGTRVAGQRRGALILARDRRSARWTRASMIRGRVFQGDPPRGDFVPAGRAGLGYVRPGYCLRAAPGRGPRPRAAAAPAGADSAAPLDLAAERAGGPDGRAVLAHPSCQPGVRGHDLERRRASPPPRRGRRSRRRRRRAPGAPRSGPRRRRAGRGSRPACGRRRRPRRPPGRRPPPRRRSPPRAAPPRRPGHATSRPAGCP